MKLAHKIAFHGSGNEVIWPALLNKIRDFNAKHYFTGPDKVRINLEYLKNRTFWLDLKLIIYTVLGKKL